jgi:hypothetical protein
MLARFCNAKRDICASEALPQQRLSSNGFAKRGVPSPSFRRSGAGRKRCPSQGALRLVVGDDILD